MEDIACNLMVAVVFGELSGNDSRKIEFPRDELIGFGWLVEGSPYHITVSVVGLGGLGKSTLVKKLSQ